MNFEQCRVANGQRVTMFAAVIEVGAAKTGKNGNYRSVKLRDDCNEEHYTTIHQGKGLLIGDAVLGQRCQFSIGTYQGQNGIAYGGYWNDRAKVNQIPPPYAPKPPQNAPQSHNTPQGVDYAVKEREKAEGMVRHGILCAILGSMREQPVELKTWEPVYREVLQHTRFVMQGEYYFAPEPDKSITEGHDEAPPDDSDIPF